MMHPHGIVGGDGSVEKGPGLTVGILLPEFGEGVLRRPALEEAPFDFGKVRNLRYGLVHAPETPKNRRQRGIEYGPEGEW